MVKSFIVLALTLASQICFSQDAQQNINEPAAVTVAALASDCPPHNVGVALETDTNSERGKNGNKAGGTAKNDSEIDRMPSQVEEIETIVAINNNPFGGPCQ